MRKRLSTRKVNWKRKTRRRYRKRRQQTHKRGGTRKPLTGTLKGTTRPRTNDIPVRVNMPDGKVHQLKVRPEITVHALKNQISSLSGINPSQQQLHIQSQEEPLHNYESLKTFQTPHASVVDLYMIVSQPGKEDLRRQIISSFPDRRRETNKLLKKIKTASTPAEKRRLQEELKHFKRQTQDMWDQVSSKKESTSDDLDDLLD